MKLRITPLNIVAAASGLFAVYYFFKTPATTTINFDVWSAVLALVLVVVCFITDLIFRFMLKDLKRIWLVEGVFILIAVIVLFILLKYRN